MAERGLTAGFLAAIAAGVVRPAIFYQGEFIDGSGNPAYAYLWTGIGDYPWNGQTWVGGGSLLKISQLQETTDIAAVGFSISLSGIPSSNIALALTGMRQGKPGKLWLALFDASGALIADPYLMRSGRLDIAPIQDDGQTCTITVNYEDRLIDLTTPRDRRYTHEDQQLDYPGDRGFEYVSSLQQMDIVWGRQ